MKLFPDRCYLRPFTQGERIRIPHYHSPRLGIGARRKGYAQASMIVSGAGLKWHAYCVQWAHGCLYEIGSPAYQISRHD
jgi:hypothetical protein